MYQQLKQELVRPKPNAVDGHRLKHGTNRGMQSPWKVPTAPSSETGLCWEPPCVDGDMGEDANTCGDSSNWIPPGVQHLALLFPLYEPDPLLRAPLSATLHLAMGGSRHWARKVLTQRKRGSSQYGWEVRAKFRCKRRPVPREAALWSSSAAMSAMLTFLLLTSWLLQAAVDKPKLFVAARGQQRMIRE